MKTDDAADRLDPINRLAALAGGGALLDETWASSWWAVALRGVLAVLFGLVAFFWPGLTILSLILVFAAYRLADGLFAIAAAFRAGRRGRRWGLPLLGGILDLAVAAIAFLWPLISVIAFVLLVAAWSLASGILMLAAAWRLARDHGRWWLVLGGLLSIAFAVLLAVAPLPGAMVLTWWIGAYALATGVLLLVVAFKLHARYRELRPPAAPARPA